jgi:hypothetical protein
MLSKRQAKTLWEQMQNRNTTAGEEFTSKNKERLESGYKVLREEWGTNYDEMVKKTNKGLERLDEDGTFRKWMKSTGINAEPEMLKFAAKVVSAFTEDKFPDGSRSSMPMNKEKATQEINKIYSEALKEPGKHPLMNKRDPAHMDWVKKVEKLSTIAGGSK